ncbi:MAG TPA: iron-sulfur cluster assembly accessory protein [Planctomycetota bacterium]|nr:iron-sulfur cluster assembly accessory protein [Planctomycetota bacterium]
MEIHLTDAAVNAIRKRREADKALTPQDYLRIEVKGGGCSGMEYNTRFDKRKSLIDEEFTFGDVKVLVDKKSLLYLDNVTIDYYETLMQSGFKFSNPNASATCGCDKSFAV